MKKNTCCCPVCKVAGLLVVLGAVNWGLIGALNRNAVSALLGSGTKAERIVYIVIGVAGLMKFASCFVTCPCAKKCAPAEGDAGSSKDSGCCGPKH